MLLHCHLVYDDDPEAQLGDLALEGDVLKAEPALLGVAQETAVGAEPVMAVGLVLELRDEHGGHVHHHRNDNQDTNLDAPLHPAPHHHLLCHVPDDVAYALGGLVIE